MKRIMVLAAMAALLSLYGCGQDTLTSPSTTLADDMGEIKENKKGPERIPPVEVPVLVEDRRGRGRDKVGQADEMGEIKENKKGPDRTPPPQDPGPVDGRGGRARERVQDGN